MDNLLLVGAVSLATPFLAGILMLVSSALDKRDGSDHPAARQR